MFELASVMFHDLWNARIAAEATSAKALLSEAASIERQIEKLMDRIVETDTPSLIPAYESRVQNLTMEKARLSERIAQCGRPLADVDTRYRTATGFRNNPYDLWSSERLTDKRAVLKLAFAEPIGYDRNTGFRTSKTAAPFNVFGKVHRLQAMNQEWCRLQDSNL